jgi:hypothetical protein
MYNSPRCGGRGDRSEGIFSATVEVKRAFSKVGG